MKWKGEDWFLLTSIYIWKGTSEDKSGESTRKGKLRKILLLRLRDPEEVILEGSELEGQKKKVKTFEEIFWRASLEEETGKEFIFKKRSVWTERGVDGINCIRKCNF